jgi:CubicO group peptidase (beta-lactamase class C family)
VKKDIEITELTEKLQANIPELMSTFNVPGLSFVIIRNAQLVWSKCFGLRSNDTKEFITEDTVFEAASLSKPVYAYAALKLCESGVLGLDDPLNDYLPDYIPDEPRLSQITMRHVLSHTSGLPNWRPKGKALEMQFSPGERFLYSGEGFMYLQEVINQVTKQEPAAFVRSEILEPFGMQHSSFTWNGDENLAIAVGHDENGKAQEKNLWEKVYAAASLHSTPTDFGKFMCTVMKPSSANPNHLGAKMNQEMLKTQVQVNDSATWHPGFPKKTIQTNDLVGWCLGWGTQKTANGESIWHWGDNVNYRAFAIGYLEDKSGLVVMTNGKNGQKIIHHILYNLIGGEYPGLEWLYD